MINQISLLKPWVIFRYASALLIVAGITAVLIHVTNVIPIMTVKHVTPVFGENSLVNLLILYFHVSAAVPPLILGPLAFSTKIRVSFPSIHRWIGTIYCACIWWSSLLGILLATSNRGGLLSRMGFATLGFMWFFTTTMAYVYARKREYNLHRRWMIRSFALTLAVAAVRPLYWWPPSFIPFDEWRIIVTWLCWVPNLIIGDIYARCTTVTGKLKKNLVNN